MNLQIFIEFNFKFRSMKQIKRKMLTPMVKKINNELWPVFSHTAQPDNIVDAIDTASATKRCYT